MSAASAEEFAGGEILRVRIERPPGNILDSEVTLRLTEVFASLAERREVKAVVLAGALQHFSYGASVQEHRVGEVEGMLARFHGLLRVVANSGVVVLSAVRGRCLGGGLELASFGHRVVSSPSAKFGQPEIALGVFAPIASLFLADRVGRGGADDLLLSGRTIGADEALKLGLVDELADDPEHAAIHWAEHNLLAHSASSLRFATRAARFEVMQRFEECIAGIEQLYLEELMKSHDANEGLSAFLAKRKPTWRNS